MNPQAPTDEETAGGAEGDRRGVARGLRRRSLRARRHKDLVNIYAVLNEINPELRISTKAVRTVDCLIDTIFQKLFDLIGHPSFFFSAAAAGRLTPRQLMFAAFLLRPD